MFVSTCQHRSALGVVWTLSLMPGASTCQWDLLFLQTRSPRTTSRDVYSGTSWKPQLSLKSSGKQQYQIWMLDVHGKLATNFKKRSLKCSSRMGQPRWPGHTVSLHRPLWHPHPCPDILLQLLSRSLISGDYFGPWSCLNAFAVCVVWFGCHNHVSVLGQLTEMIGKGLDSF